MSLPSGYRQLEYIQSTGTQYIDTGIIETNDTAINCKFNIDTAAKDYLFGSQQNLDYMAYNGFYYNNVLEYNYQEIAISASNSIEIKEEVEGTTNTIIINGTSYSAEIGICQNSSLLIFAIRYKSDVQNGSVRVYSGSARVYYFQIVQGGTLVFDGIPCINASGEVGLYDLVGKQFYGNAGTGTFTAGPIIAIAADKSEITKLEYIQSTGTQYVNTGFKPNNNSRVVLDFEPTAAYSSIVGIFGIRDTKSATAAKMFVFWNNGARTFRTDYFGTQKTMTIPTLLARQTVDKDKNVTTIGSVSVSNTVSTGQCSNNLYLFCTNNAGTAQYFAKLKLYSCKIYDNGTIIRDYIPAKLSDGTVGLYDKLSGLLYINAGTGTFEPGPSSLNLPVNIGGTWKDANEVFVNIGGTWKTVEAAFVNIGGTWKELG